MLLETQLAAFVGASLLLGAFVLAHRRFPSDFSIYWILGWTFYSLRFGFDTFGTLFGRGPLLTITTNVAVATSAILIFLAVVRLGDGDRPYTREAWGLWALLSGWTVLAVGLEFGFLLTYTPLYVAFGLVQVVTAYLFYQYLSKGAYSSTPLIVGSLLIWGLHKFNYPVVRPIESIAPYGYAFGAVLSFTTGLGVMMFLLEDAERKAARERNEAQRRSDEFEALFNTIPDAVFIHDLDGNFLKVNETATEALGYSAAALRTMSPRDIVAPDHKSAIEDRIEQAASGEPVTFDSTHVTADGEHIDVSVNAVTITYRGEEAILAVARDVTDRHHLEQRLSVVNRILRHDIRSAVNVIKGNAEMARESPTGSTAPLDTVVDEADRLHDIAETAQQIERLHDEAGATREVVDLSAVVQSNVSTLRGTYPNATIRTDVHGPLHAQVAPGFSDAVANLLSNAIVHNHRAEPTVTVAAESTRENVTVTVADDGPGIPDDEIKPLQNGEETALQHTSGLGLWFVYWIIEESGGRLRFEENDPTGTVVKLVVPRADSSSDSTA